MKLKLIILVAAMLPLGMNAYAMEINKGRILEHKVWTTGEGNISFKTIARPTLLKNKNFTDMRNIKSEGMINIAIDTTGFTQHEQGLGIAFPIRGEQYVMVQNLTTEKEVYNYFMMICADMDDRRSQCGYLSETIELEPQGSFYSNDQPQLSVAFEKAGLYGTEVGAGLTRIVPTGNAQNHFSYSTGMIQVS